MAAAAECLRLTGGAAHRAAELAAGLRVHPQAMRANVELTDGLIVTERLAAALTPALGRSAAKALAASAAAEAAAEDRPLRLVLAGREDISAHLDQGRLQDLLDPAHYTGAAGALVDRILMAYEGSSPV